MFPYSTLPNILQDLIDKSIPINSIPILVKLNKTLRNQCFSRGFKRRIHSTLLKSDRMLNSTNPHPLFHVKIEDFWFHLTKEKITVVNGKKSTLKLDEKYFWILFNQISALKSLQIVIEKTITEEHNRVIKRLLPRVKILSELSLRVPYSIAVTLFTQFNPRVTDWFTFNLQCQLIPEVTDFLDSLFSKPSIQCCSGLFWMGKQFPWSSILLLSSPLCYWVFQTQNRVSIENFVNDLLANSMQITTEKTLIIHLFESHFQFAENFHQKVQAVFWNLHNSGKLLRLNNGMSEFLAEIKDYLKETKIFGELLQFWEHSASPVFRLISGDWEILYRLADSPVGYVRFVVRWRRIKNEILFEYV